MKNWQAAALAWLLGTALVGGGYLAYHIYTGLQPDWRALGGGAALVGLYALYLGWRYRADRP